jgi:cobyrinic acid a,c-diamide synthase
MPGPAWTPDDGGPVVPVGGDDLRIAIARGPAFSFHYQENLELLTGAGAQLAPFDPLGDEALPAGAGALVLAGGFPEIFGEQLAANVARRDEIRAFAASGRPVLAECGGLLYLCRELDGHAMCGVLPARASMTKRLTLGYRDAVAATATPWLAAGERLRGHEFHYSAVETLDPRADSAWQLSTRAMQRPEGIVRGGVQAGYLHVHWAGHPELARSFARAAAGTPPARAVA